MNKLLSIFKREGFKRLLLRLIRKIVQFIRIVFYKCLSDLKLKKCQASIKQPVLFSGRGDVFLSKCQIGVWPSPSFFSTYAHIEARNKGSFISIGDNSCLNNNATIIADKSSVEIGNNVKIGHNVFICDSDFHGTKIENRNNEEYEVASVKISDNVFIGSNVSVLKGVCIGRNSVISAGSVVTHNIPENCIAGGIPAKLIKKIINNEAV